MKTETMPEVWSVYQMNDCDWWLARSPEEARQSAAEHYGGGTTADEMLSDETVRVDESELNRLRYCPDGSHDGPTISFKEELARRILAGPKVEMFASTEF